MFTWAAEEFREALAGPAEKFGIPFARAAQELRISLAEKFGVPFVHVRDVTGLEVLHVVV